MSACKFYIKVDLRWLYWYKLVEYDSDTGLFPDIHEGGILAWNCRGTTMKTGWF